MKSVGGGASPGSSAGAWRAILAGLCASLVGIGLARFAYTPLIPALIGAGWFTPADAAYLGAANLAGYLAGAVLAPWLARRASAAVVLRATMVLATASFFACAFPLSFAWFFVWRFASGATGGVLMVLAATSILPHVAPARRGLAGGAIFTGVGLGIVASGTVLPWLLSWGLAEAWFGLGALALVLTVAAWGGWPSDAPSAPVVAPAATTSQRVRLPLALKALYVEYALCAIGLVPHMVFLVDFVARGLGHGLDVGARYWVLVGLGATVGPLLAGAVADRIGFAGAVRVAFILQAAAVAVLTVWSGTLALVFSSVVIGASLPGVVPLVLGRVLELAPAEGHGRKVAWSRATTAFAIGQAAAAYGYSYLFARTDGDYTLLFAIGAGALVAAVVIDVAANTARRGPPPG